MHLDGFYGSCVLLVVVMPRWKRRLTRIEWAACSVAPLNRSHILQVVISLALSLEPAAGRRARLLLPVLILPSTTHTSARRRAPMAATHSAAPSDEAIRRSCDPHLDSERNWRLLAVRRLVVPHNLRSTSPVGLVHCLSPLNESHPELENHHWR